MSAELILNVIVITPFMTLTSAGQAIVRVWISAHDLWHHADDGFK